MALQDHSSTCGEIEEEQCPICWGLLCEPVSWPGCSHHFCLLCTLKTRQRLSPCCPLCRAEAPRVWKATALQVDAACVARVRQSVGFSAYTAQRRKLWAAAVETPEELKAMPMYCTGLKRRQLRAGTRLGLRLVEPRYWEIVKRAMAPGGTRRFAAVTRTRALASACGEEIAVGAQGCVCEIQESTEGEDGNWNVIVEVGAPCNVLDVKTEEMQQGPPLFIGKLEEVEPEDSEDDGEDGEDVDAVVLGEDGQLELLRERVQLLELLNAAMELEQARLEQRRLELTLLLSHRQLYQGLIEMQSEVASLVGLDISATRRAPRASETTLRRIPEGTSSAASISQSRRRSGHRLQELHDMLETSDPVVDSRRAGEENLRSSMPLPRRLAASTAHVAASGLEPQQFTRQNSRGLHITASRGTAQRSSEHGRNGRGMTAAEAMRRRGATTPGNRTIAARTTSRWSDTREQR